MKLHQLTLFAMIVAVAAHASLFAGDFEKIERAIGKGDLGEVKRLVLEEKIDVNIKDISDAYGWMPIHCAASWKQLEIVKFLISCGADVNVKTEDGRAPLRIVARWRRPEMIKLLVACGADIGVKDADGKTALEIARNFNISSETIAFLEKIEKFTASIEDPSTRDFAITTIFTGNKYSSEEKQLFFDVMAGQGYCKALTKVFELGCETKGLFQELFGKEIMYEDVYKAEICSRFLDNPFVIKNLVSGNYYDATRIYDHYSDKQRMYENPKICVEIINELKKQQMLNVIMAQRKGSNIFFNFK